MSSEAGTVERVIVHSLDARQTSTRASSIDPWHSAEGLNQRGDQTGFDSFFTSGVTNGLPAMVAVAVIYGAPEDAAPQMAYLKKRDYPIAWVEWARNAMGNLPCPRIMRPHEVLAWSKLKLENLKASL